MAFRPEQLTIKARDAVADAGDRAAEAGHPQLTPLHLLKALLEETGGVVEPLLKRVGVNLGQLNSTVDAELSRLPARAGGRAGEPPGADAYFMKVLDAARKRADAMKDKFTSTEHLLLGLLDAGDAAGRLLEMAGADEKDLLAGLKEVRGGQTVNTQNPEGTYQALEQYGQDLVELARRGKIDPVIGRDAEIRRVIQVLSRRRKNNPCLIGEPGVGKTAIAEGLAMRIVDGDVPTNLKDKTVIALDMGALVAGAKFRGEFEERLKACLKEITDSDGDIICFLDEIHLLVGAGKGDGAMDAANLLKPALARGDLRCVGATTLNEYRQYIEKDPALERRFQPVLVGEPSVEDTLSILRGIVEKYQTHHGVKITDSALRQAAALSDRYINDRFLPDKAIDLIDEAASRLRMEIDSMPAELDEANRALARLRVEAKVLEQESSKEAGERLEELNREIADREESFTALKTRWEAEKAVLAGLKPLQEEIDALRTDRERAFTTARQTNDNAAYQAAYEAEVKLKAAEEKLAELERKFAEIDPADRLLREEVTGEDVAKVVSAWTGVPAARMLQAERDKLLNMESLLKSRMVGQDEAVAAVADAVRRSRSGLGDPGRPVGSFLFLGPTGVGKTELSKALAEFLFDSEKALVRLDMSEFMEKHAVARLIGAPPGYVGYEEGGKLTEAVRRKPYSVILLDEVEKAHPDVLNILLQVLDDGRLTDGKGRTVDFSNCVIVMTSNLGSDKILEMSEAGELPSEVKAEVLNILRRALRPEFLNRVDSVVVFSPLTRQEIRQIVDLQLAGLQRRVEAEGFHLEVSDNAKQLLANEGYDPTFGARPLRRVIQDRLQNGLANALLDGRYEDGATITVDASPDGFVFGGDEPGGGEPAEPAGSSG